MGIIKKHKLQLAEKTLLIVLFLAKIFIYNTLIDNNNAIIKLSFISLTYVILIITFVNIIKGIKGDIVYLVIYTLISLIMFADVAYYKYFNQLTSIINIRQFGQLSSIGESVSYVLGPINFLLIADIIPLIIYYFYIRRNIRLSEMDSLGKKHSISIALSTIALVIVSVVSVNALSDDINLFRQEFFTYHLSDIYNTLFLRNDISDMDELLKESIDKRTNNRRKFYGIAKGKNVITIQVEGLQNFVINREYNGQTITPNLNKIINEDSIHFDRYYQQLGRGNTSDAEFVSHNSLYPAMDGQTYLKYYDNTYYGLPWILKDNGYSTAAFHGYKGSFWNRDRAYPYQGFDRYYSGDSDYGIIGPTIGLGINDSEFFMQSINYIKSIKEPYYAFLITLSSHHPFELPDVFKKIRLSQEHEGTLFGNYIQSINYADAAIGKFIDTLKREGLYEDTIINIYGDHFGLSSLDEENKRIMTEYLGYEYDFDEMMRVPLIVHIPGSELNETISTIGGQIDFLPTILNLLGMENNKGIMLGQDLVNSKEGFVAQQTYMLKGSYLKDDMVFSMSRDGIYNNSRAWSISTRQSLDLVKCREDYERAIKEIDKSNYILKNDLLDKYIEDREKLSVERKTNVSKISPEKLIAHAGGRVEGLSYTNSKEALDKSYEDGYKLIELDFEWTTDGNLVLLHDWNNYVRDAFSVEPKPYSTDEFKSFNMIKGLTQMSLEDLAEWLNDHSDVYIVTDIKRDNVKGLELIKEKYPELTNQFIPQIYKLEQYISVQELGYSNIILTLYMSNYSDDELVDFVKREEIFAVTMPIARARTELPNKLKNENIFVYAHTINDSELRKELEENGVDGFYTDDLLP